MTQEMGAAARILASTPYLEGLDPYLLSAMGRAAIRRVYGQDEIVFLQGEPSAGLYVVQSGWLKSVKSLSTGREQIVRFVGPGEAFNEIACLAGSSNQVTVIALEPAEVWMIPVAVLQRFLDTEPGFARRLTENLARRVLHLLSLVEDLSLRPVEARLARFLLAESEAGRLHRRPWATQAEMAARLGTVPDVLQRALRDLADRGLITVDRRSIAILDPEGLRATALIE